MRRKLRQGLQWILFTSQYNKPFRKRREEWNVILATIEILKHGWKRRKRSKEIPNAHQYAKERREFRKGSQLIVTTCEQIECRR
jgi:hypothetical protein